MSVFQALILGIIQGATEFIPVSSSGHLVLVPWLFGWDSSGLVFDAIVHWGTLLAILVYFADDIISIVTAVLRGLVQRRPFAEDESRLGWLIVLGTVPAAVIGYLFEAQFEALFEEPLWAAVFLLVTGGILLLSEWLHERDRPLSSLTPVDAVSIGFAQALAILPGISRSGATIATGLWRNLERATAARFSFLLMAPIVFGAGLLQTLDLFQGDTSSAALLPIGVGFVAAAVTGYFCIEFLLQYLQRATLRVFAYWCWAFGLFSLIVALVRG